MKVLPINNNQNNTNFKGTVSKSIVYYLKEVEFVARNRSKSFLGSSGKENITAETYSEIKNMIKGIMSKLNDFMSKTDPRTIIFLSDMTDKRCIRIANTALEKCIMGDFDWPKNSINNDECLLTAPELKGVSDKHSHTFEELQSFDVFTTNLIEKISPEEIDGALFDKKVIEVVKRAEETAPKNRFENRLAFNNLDRLAPKFHREPIYTEQFNIIQALAYKMQEEKAKDPVEQSKEELKI